MPHQLPFPITASPKWIYGIFFGFLIIFHVLFLKVWPLDKKRWQIVDYLWLGLAVLGLFAGTAQVRKIVAQNQISLENTYMVSTYERLKDQISFLTSSAVCRKFNRTEYSPKNFDAIQIEYDNVCSFGGQLNSRTPADPPEDLKVLKLDEHPTVTDGLLTDMLSSVKEKAKIYIEARRVYDQTVDAQNSTYLEIVLTFSAPLLLAIALALRITKVTGELRMKT